MSRPAVKSPPGPSIFTLSHSHSVLAHVHNSGGKITRARGIGRYSSSFEQCGGFVYLDKRADLHRQTAIIHFPRHGARLHVVRL